MRVRTASLTMFACSAIAICLGLQPASIASASPAEPQATGQPAVTRRIGAIKAISGTTITLAPDSGPEITVTVSATTHILRVAPGEKNLKNATPAQLTDLQVGDRILVGGQASDDAKSMSASSIVLMKLTDVTARQERERQDWQKRGLGGLVKTVDSTTGVVTISVTIFTGTKTIAVRTSTSTVFRRYAPESVKFDDAKASSLQEIQPGDQLRARGDRSADGAELTAEEVVTGSFRNVAGTVNSVDASAGTISVQDLLGKKTVVVKVSADSQMHKLPAEVAQRIAMRLKGAMPPGTPGASPASAGGSAPATQSGGSPGEMRPGGGGVGGAGMRSGGGSDLQQMLNRMPAVSLDELHKGDAVLIVATQEATNGTGTVITLLSGVEPILQAAPNGSQAMMLAPWSLGGAPGGELGQ